LGELQNDGWGSTGLAYAIDEVKALLEKNADDVEDLISS
jgi:hypothetical protein